MKTQIQRNIAISYNLQVKQSTINIRKYGVLEKDSIHFGVEKRNVWYIPTFFLDFTNACKVNFQKFSWRIFEIVNFTVVIWPLYMKYASFMSLVSQFKL